MMKSALAVLLLILSAAFLEGMPTSSRGRCLCQGRRMIRVNMLDVAEVEYHRSSPSCSEDELIIFFKTNGKTGCLDITKKQGRIIKEAIMRKRK
ncbi:C-X-C motif chemokine 11-6 [Anolis carolinensis]|uniref:C-X-C motif chemokine 11-6 n=1 Tax=Anolis carolinensis TaxID=28377 RepID=UPI002F2B6B4D